MAAHGGPVRAAAPGSEAPFRLSWTERGGPPPAQRRGRGFGSLILEEVLPEDFMGVCTVTHPAQGLCCRLETYMSRLGLLEAG